MSEKNNKIKHIIRDFLPSWFVVIMGIGIIISSSFAYSAKIPFLAPFAKVLAYINIVLFLLLLIIWILRWILNPKGAITDLKHPVLTHFYPTISIAIMIIATNLQMIGVSVNFAVWIWILGVLGTILLSILIPFLIFNSKDVALHHMNPSWFIPPVALIAIPLFGFPYLSMTSGNLNQLVILLNYFGLGAGIMVYISLLAIVLHRFIVHPPLPNTLAPTIWIELGPIGATIVSLVNLVGQSSFLTVKEPFNVISLLLWGFGFWWLILALVMTAYYLKNLKIPYSLSWWAYIFPLGVYVVSSHVITAVFPSLTIIDWIGFLLYFCLVIIWLVTSIKTLVGVFTGKIFLRESPQKKQPLE